MKIPYYLLACLFAIFVLASTVTASDQLQPQATPAICEQLTKDGVDQETLAKRGCCSWHQGVCGCQGGRVVCCDGSFSPSCTCNKETPQSEISG